MTIINRFRPFSRGRMKRLIQVVFVLGVVFGLNHELKQFSSGVNVKVIPRPVEKELFTHPRISTSSVGSDNKEPVIEGKHSIIGEQRVLDYMAGAIIVQFIFLSNERAEVIFTNNGSSIIENSGWAIYVSTMLYLTRESDSFVWSEEDLHRDKLLHVSRINGNLYTFSPVATNFMILPGESVRCRVGTYWTPSRFLVAPNWYVATGGLQPRTIASTIGEELTFVSYFHPPSNGIYAITPDFGHALLTVIPKPKQLKAGDGKILINRYWTVNADNHLQSERLFLSDKLGLKESSLTRPTSKAILLNLASAFHARNVWTESYDLQVDNSNEIITITGQDPAGVFNGIQTLLSLTNDKGEVPQLSVKDWPRFSYRGLMVDVSRNFKTKHQILKILDAMAMYKLNKFHFHLSDSEGWRLEIPGLEELTTVGARRCHDLEEKFCILSQHGSGPYTSSSGTGYYSTEDYREILRHAKQRHILVIPEFDFPGHSHAAIRSMLARRDGLIKEDGAQSFLLSDLEDVSRYISFQGFFNDAINPCLASTYKFLDHLLSVLARLHEDIQPLTLFHFGGDEVPLGVWVDSPACQNMTQNLTENGALVRQFLMKHFVRKLSKIAHKHGVNIAGWSDAFTEEGNDGWYVLRKAFLDTENPVAYFWGDEKEHWRLQALMDNGYKMVLSPSDILYLDHSPKPGFSERGLNWATDHSNSRKILRYSPPDNENILGIEGTLWSELIRTADQMDSMIFPRLLAIAERAWNKAPWDDYKDYQVREQAIDTEWVNFANTLSYKELERLDRMGIAYRIPPPEPRLICREYCNKLHVTTELPGLKVEYSTDNGVTWNETTPEIEVKGKMKFRTRSPDQTRFSRVVEFDP